jgi:membrane protein YqaA with SNARE-associated domain
MDELAVYAGLFAVAFAAATILPMQSEAALAGLLLTESFPAPLLVLLASAGNVLGSAANWLIGRGVERFRTRKWFPPVLKCSIAPRNGTIDMGDGRCC